MVDLTESGMEKLKRASRHIGELNTEIKRFLDAKPYRIEAQPDPKNPGEVLIRAFVLEDIALPAIEWGTIVGEIVHDIRAALDHLVWALTIYHQRRTPKEPLPPSGCWWRQVGFPIFLTEEAWKAGHKPYLRGIDPSLIQAFHDVQPFTTGKPYLPTQDSLWILQELWNRDKHRTVSLVLAQLEVRDPVAERHPAEALARWIAGEISGDEEFPDVYSRVIKKAYGPIKDGKVLARMKFLWSEPPMPLTRLNRYVNKHARLTFDIAFEEGPPSWGMPVREGLMDLWDRVQPLVTWFGSWLHPSRHIAQSRSHCPAAK